MVTIMTDDHHPANQNGKLFIWACIVCHYVEVVIMSRTRIFTVQAIMAVEQFTTQKQNAIAVHLQVCSSLLKTHVHLQFFFSEVGAVFFA